MKKDRDDARAMLGINALFSLNRAAELIPIGDGEARRWLEAHGLVRHVNERPVVRWCDVLEALGEPPVAPGRKPAPKCVPLPRVKL